MRTHLYLIFTMCAVLWFPDSLLSQTKHFKFKSNTGNKANVEIPASANTAVSGISLLNDDEIGVYTPSGLCVGGAIWNGSNIYLTVWGDDRQPSVRNGIKDGEPLLFRIWRHTLDIEYPIQVKFTSDSGTYTANRVFRLLSFSPTTQLTHFIPCSNTNNFAIVIIPSSINANITGLPIALGDEIGIFSPEGICVGAEVWTGSTIAITVWGDRVHTKSIEGIKPGEQMYFRIWRRSTNAEYPASISFMVGTNTYGMFDFAIVKSLVVQMRVKIKVFLQGPYNAETGFMRNTLAALNYLPTSHPYSIAPWGYTVSEPLIDTALYARHIIDWLLIELRSTWNGPAIDRQAALLKDDGTVLCPADGLDGVVFDTASLGYYYIVIKHRNHLSIMSKDSINMPIATTYNFSSAQSQAYGVNPMIAIGPIFGMITGDYNASGDINTIDELYVKIGCRDGYTGYRAQDMDLSGDMNIIDALRVKQGRQNGYQTRVP